MIAHTTYRKPRGGVMIMALVIMAIATFGFTAWIGLIRQRARSGDFQEQGVMRRLAVMNGVSQARDYSRNWHLTRFSDDDGLSNDSLSGWGAINTAVWTGYPMEGSVRLAGLNGFSPSYDYPYSTLLPMRIGTKNLTFSNESASYSTENTYVNTYARSRSPMLGGDLLVVHRPTETSTLPAITGSINVYGRVLHFAPDTTAANFSARCTQFVSPKLSSMNVAPVNLAGASLQWSNMPWTPVTFGTTSTNGAADYTGRLDVIAPSKDAGNSFKTELTALGSTIPYTGSSSYTDSRGLSNTVSSSKGTSTVTLTQGSTTAADLPSIVVSEKLRELRLVGQTGSTFSSYAQYRPAMAVVYTQTGSTPSTSRLTTIRLQNQNRRRMVLALKQSGYGAGTAVNVVLEDSNLNSEWHLLIIAENTPINLTMTGGATTLNLYGGIQTDSNFTVQSGKSVNVYLETDTRGLIKMTPRMAWTETYLRDNL